MRSQIMSGSELADALPQMSNEDRVYALNCLLTQGRVQVLGAHEDPRFRSVSAEEAVKFKGLDAEETLLYQTIAAAEDRGIWTKDMKVKTNLPQTKISKHLKTLELRGLIKAIKSVQTANRKIYMLMDLQPGKELTGGPWYEDQNIDTEFIDTVRTVALRHLSEATRPLSVQEISNFIIESGIFHQVLQEEDVAHVMTTLTWDGDVEVVSIGRDAQNRYRLQGARAPESTALSDIPCGVCPVFNECQDGGYISPENCEYYTEWWKKFDF
jgi:DNA-directed RNA polymerase III subunit RPC6